MTNLERPKDSSNRGYALNGKEPYILEGTGRTLSLCCPKGQES